MTITDEVRAALSRDTPVSSAEAATLLARLHPEIAKTEMRRDEIAVAGPRSRNSGPLYRKILLSGTNDEIAEMQREFDRLCVELDRLRAMGNGLQDLRRMMLLKEADTNLPALQGQLAAALTDAEEKRRALEESLDGVDGAYLAITQARSHLHSAGMKPTAVQSADADTIGRLLSLGPLSRVQRVSMHRDSAVHASNLGMFELTSTGGEAGAAAGWLP